MAHAGCNFNPRSLALQDRIYAILSEQPMTIQELAAVLCIAKPTAYRHVRGQKRLAIVSYTWGKERWLPRYGPGTKDARMPCVDPALTRRGKRVRSEEAIWKAMRDKQRAIALRQPARRDPLVAALFGEPA